MGQITLVTESIPGEPEYDAVLVREKTVLCLRNDGTARVVPLSKLERIDADSGLLQPDVPLSFYGGAAYAFIDTEAFPEFQDEYR